MNSNAILSSDMLDILFENRNKNYGAYILRKFYPNRVKTSLLIMLGMVTIFSAFTFLPEGKKNIIIPYTGDSLIVKKYEIPQKKEQPIQKQPATQKVPTQKLLSNFIVVHNNDTSDSLIDYDHLAIGSTTSIIDPGPPGILTVGNPGTGEVLPTPEPPIENINAVEDDPDVQATFPGGNKELIRFLERNLQSPEEINEGVQVKIKFVVGFDGNLEGFDVIQDGGKDFNNEVIRVLKKMPKWNPGKKGGRNVRVYYYLPVKFAPMD